jgi:AcrR family transcriptional regulator
LATTAAPAVRVIRRQDARITRSRKALHVALLQLVEQQPLEAITIREITDAAGVGYATFYRHYPTKAALLDDVAADQIRELVGLSIPALGPVLGDHDTREACLAILRYVDLHHAVWSALLNGGAAGAVREEIIQVSREVTDTVPHGDSWLPLDLSHRFVASAMVELLSWWLGRRDMVTVEKGAELLDRLIIGPVVESGRS